MRQLFVESILQFYNSQFYYYPDITVKRRLPLSCILIMFPKTHLPIFLMITLSRLIYTRTCKQHNSPLPILHAPFSLSIYRYYIIPHLHNFYLIIISPFQRRTSQRTRRAHCNWKSSILTCRHPPQFRLDRPRSIPQHLPLILPIPTQPCSTIL